MSTTTATRGNPMVVQLGGLTLHLPPSQALAMPMVIVLTMAMMILPLPPMLLDLLFSLNTVL